ncbi:MAG: hypothetical protein COV36_01310 [Alphaproteobacteria bacterium CG11_big_fil_rev_8_21_14_0_20_44_7]|nr:MAG: hypothetical protein COV36_01310 [Alphaproteobacteria bacterium CG11_big_fil_rev_8_21_14_0_20_44_7]
MPAIKRIKKLIYIVISYFYYGFLGFIHRNKKVAVLISCYNSAQTIEKAVDSILSQSHKNVEVLIVDDASSDNSIRKLQGLQSEDKRIRIFRSKHNHGVFYNFNWLMQHTDAEIITFQAADDFSHPFRLRIQLGGLMSGKDVVASTHLYCRVNREEQPIEINGEINKRAFALMMFKKTPILSKLGYFDTVRFGADTEFWERLKLSFAPNQIIRMPLVLYYALLNTASLTGTGRGAHKWEKIASRKYRSEINGVRKEYHENSREWHQSQISGGNSLKIDFPPAERPFETPRANSVTIPEDEAFITEVTG